MAWVFALGLVACSESHVLGPGGEPGICCPVTSFTGCSPGGTPLPGGGWARDEASCTYTVAGFDGRPFERVTDPFGCDRVQESSSGCCGCLPEPDAGPPVDAPPIGSECDALGEAACLGASGCVPTYDDACCPTCDGGGFCADCTDLVFHVCRPFADACMAAFCSSTAPGGCEGLPVDCSDATPTEEGCSVAGCVPAVGPLPDPGEPTCVAVTANSCTVSCRRVAPDCPAGTAPEGDGSCYTDRCIPAAVCE
ncbi:MAG: hypothetical protein EVA89_02480 [Sandaracinaceae bacterium]|nr:MAG: hypothetical protein EVA89_02480 [Sandaracinaceae bacterium]